MRRNSARMDAMTASLIVYAYGSTPIPNHAAGAAVVGYSGDAAGMVEISRPVRATCKMTADLAAVLMAIELVLESGVPSARIAFWSNDPIEGLMMTRSVFEREGSLNRNMLPANRAILEVIFDKLELASRTRTTITFENRYNSLPSVEERVIGSMKFRTKQLALRAARQAERQTSAEPVEPISEAVVNVDEFGLNARKWSALVENLVEVGAIKSSPRDRMIAELSIRRAMDAFHRTLEHVRAA